MPPLTEPLRFVPLFRQYVWGGRRLGSVLGKKLPEAERIAESWEVVDHGPDQSLVAHGPHQGKSLHELVSERGDELLGRHAPQTRFPLLFKFLDAQQNLSVQVHPDDARAARLDPPDLGKTEAWLILAAEPGSRVYAGLNRGVDREVFEREVRRGAAHLCLNSFEPRVGDCIFVPAGTVHALGEGLVVAEIQQASDTTYRLYDWNRVGSDGTSRPLHLDDGLEAIDYERGPVDPQTPLVLDTHRTRLVFCEKFVLDHLRLHSGQSPTPPSSSPPSGTSSLAASSVRVGGDERFHILAALSGRLRIEGHGKTCQLRRGESLLLPAAAGRVELCADEETAVIDAYLP